MRVHLRLGIGGVKSGAFLALERLDRLHLLGRQRWIGGDGRHYDEVARLRDMISLFRADSDQADIDQEGLERQRSGAMGLGTSQQRMEPSPDWVRPKKPDLMTRGKNRRKGAS